MSEVIETAGLQYGILFEGGEAHMSFTELDAAKNYMLFLDAKGVPYSFRKREVHTRVSWTPWEQVEP